MSDLHIILLQGLSTQHKAVSPQQDPGNNSKWACSFIGKSTQHCQLFSWVTTYTWDKSCRASSRIPNTALHGAVRAGYKTSVRKTQRASQTSKYRNKFWQYIFSQCHGFAHTCMLSCSMFTQHASVYSFYRLLQSGKSSIVWVCMDGYHSLECIYRNVCEGLKPLDSLCWNLALISNILNYWRDANILVGIYSYT